jgi:hypothetical protein
MIGASPDKLRVGIYATNDHIIVKWLGSSRLSNKAVASRKEATPLSLLSIPASSAMSDRFGLTMYGLLIGARGLSKSE